MPKITIEEIDGRVTVTIECGACYVVGAAHECRPLSNPDTLN